VFKTLITGALALAVVTAFGQTKPLGCPVMGGETTAKSPYTDLKGIRYFYCCPMCKGAFENNAKTIIASAQKRGGTFGLSLTDPITRRSISPARAIPGHTDYKGIRYLFASKDNKAAFDKRLVSVQKKNPYATTATVGKYQIELRIPEEGLFAGTTLDVEFRVSDLTQNDPIEGKKGVPEAAPTATVTMPAMAGMPVMKPRIHGEGVPGDYGLELSFPHGGDFKVGIRLTPPGDKPIYAAFLLPVKDAVARTTAPKPYTVELLDLPKTPKAGEPIRLKIAIEDTKTGERVKSFDVSHTKLLHLMLVSKDLGWFVHEHPQPQPDGTFTIDWTFPAGGDYLVFADVAPKDKGAQVLSTPLHLNGPAPTWSAKLTPTKGPSRDGTIVADFVPIEKPIPIGKSTELSFKLRDAQTGRPVTDLEPYLGAQGHLMIVHQDGGTFVHSHPAEEVRAQNGEVRFNARFPRAGLYKAWAQFQRAGKISTVSFVFEVK
jgi:YHS domain-containing protein